jgi:hypothetical protein
MVITLLAFLGIWWVVRKEPGLHKLLFVLSLLLAVMVLIVGIITPMIEIDARIKKLDFLLVGEHVQFNDQILFYQTKSILQVVGILIRTGKADSVIVGILILASAFYFPSPN